MPLLSTLLAPAAMASDAPPKELAQAMALFNRAIERMDAGRPAEACPLLEESRRLVENRATGYWLAECYARTLRPASAWSLFGEVATEAERSAAAAGSAERRERETTLAVNARGREAELAKKLPRIKILVAKETASLPGLVIRLNGAPIEASQWGRAIPVDLGEHAVTASASGKVPWRSREQIDTNSEVMKVQIPPLRAKDATTNPTKSPEAFLLGGAVAFIGATAGTIAGVRALSLKSRSREICTTDCEKDTWHRMGTYSLAKELDEDSKDAAFVSTASFIVSGVAIASIALYGVWPSPKEAPPKATVRVAADAHGGGVGVLMLGSF